MIAKNANDVHLDVEGEDGKPCKSGGGDESKDGEGKGKGKKPTISKDDAKAISDELKNAVIDLALVSCVTSSGCNNKKLIHLVL